MSIPHMPGVSGGVYPNCMHISKGISQTLV